MACTSFLGWGTVHELNSRWGEAPQAGDHLHGLVIGFSIDYGSRPKPDLSTVDT